MLKMHVPMEFIAFAAKFIAQVLYRICLLDLHPVVEFLHGFVYQE